MHSGTQCCAMSLVSEDFASIGLLSVLLGNLLMSVEKKARSTIKDTSKSKCLPQNMFLTSSSRCFVARTISSKLVFHEIKGAANKRLRNLTQEQQILEERLCSRLTRPLYGLNQTYTVRKSCSDFSVGMVAFRLASQEKGCCADRPRSCAEF